METKKSYGGLDIFKMIAAFLVVAIHTSPLSSFHATADFFLTRELARLAVPFFFMVTGHFVLSDRLWGKEKDFGPIWRYLGKTGLLYLISILLYIPIGIYAGHYEGLTPFRALQMLLFDGTFYHLWYFPALLLGILLVCLLGRFCSMGVSLAVTVLLYLVGLFGDSYWGLIADVPGISQAYEIGFHLFSYTRNGLFLAPLFLAMGAWLKRGSEKVKPVVDAVGLVISFCLMTAEGLTLRYYDLQRHDSMYLLLPVCMFFLYRLLLSWNRKTIGAFRTISTWIYILHPAMIVVVRGAAKAVHATEILVENSLIFYLMVCVGSTVAALVVALVLAHFRRISFQHDFERDRAWIELDMAALEHNVRTLQGLMPGGCELMPAVKAEAYGHGAVLISRELNRLGVKAFCVASVPEGIQLRKAGVKGEILVLGYTHPRQFDLLRRYDLIQTVVDMPFAEELHKYGKKLRVHIAVDTGMHRIGIKYDEVDEISKIFTWENLKVEGIFTHLCVSDSGEMRRMEFTRTQGKVFFQLVDKLKERGHECPKKHLVASNGLLNYPEFAADYARVGIALYGVRSAEEDLELADVILKPVLSLKARVASVREIPAGDGAGYGLTFVAKRPTKLAIITIGYADGLSRLLSGGRGEVLIRGRRAPIAGRVCMDQTLVDVTGIPDVQQGDIAVLIGRSGSDVLTAYEMAEATGTITNEIFTSLGARLTRIVKPPVRKTKVENNESGNRREAESVKEQNSESSQENPEESEKTQKSGKTKESENPENLG